MNKFLERTIDATEYAAPYINSAKEYAIQAVGATKKEINKRKRKIKHKLLIIKIKNIVDLTTNIVLIFATVFASLVAILAYINKINEKKNKF